MSGAEHFHGQYLQYITPDIQLNYTFLFSSRLCGATVARPTPDRKVACSNHVRVKGNVLILSLICAEKHISNLYHVNLVPEL